MEVSERRMSTINGVVVFVIFAISLFCMFPTANAALYTVELLEKPLIISPIPLQQAQVNSHFKFSLQPFINILKPEVNYRITFIWPAAQGSPNGLPFKLSDPPSGFTRTDDGENSCSEPFRLKYNQSCIMRFYVDKNNYVYSGNIVNKDRQPVFGKSNGPRVSWSEFGAHASNEQNFDSVLQNIAEPTQLTVTPTAQDGLQYDSSLLSIIGTPTRTGIYHFTLNATNGKTTAEPKNMDINVGINPHDTPVFKHNHSLASAMPAQTYRLNLIELIESRPGFAVTNQVRFSIVNTMSPSWLSLDQETSTILQGKAPVSDAGQIKEVTLIATSNTGGDSLPMTIQIPVAFDLEKRPVIEKNIRLSAKAGDEIHYNFQTNIIDPTMDGSLKLILEKIAPAAPWLLVSDNTPTEINGVVPNNAAGQLYQLTLHANTAIGGNSDSITIPLQISISLRTR